jgi:phosphonopyruvate hydrolase
MGTHLEMVRAIGEVQDAPVVADIDTGFGNAVSVAYAVPRYAAAGAAAVVMEDKTFPKDSSLRPGGQQELVPMGEFQGKVEAAKALGRGMLVVARTEALIAVLGQDEALRRGAAYAEAGADAVLIHSKQKTPDEILAFCQAWPGQVPLVLVPTSYPQLSFADVASLGKVGLVICGNHAIRAAVAAMRDTFRRILAEGGIAGVEARIASVAEVFALQGDPRLRELERAYLR